MDDLTNRFNVVFLTLNNFVELVTAIRSFCSVVLRPIRWVKEQCQNGEYLKVIKKLYLDDIDKNEQVDADFILSKWLPLKVN